MKKTVFILSVFLCQFAMAQNKMLTMQDAFVNARTTLAPETLKQLQFIKGTNEYVYLKKVNDVMTFVKGDFKSTGDLPFVTLSQLNDKLKSAGLSAVENFPAVQFGKEEWIMTIKGSKIALNPVTNTYKTLVDKSIADKQHAEESKAGYIAYVDNDNLFVTDGKNARKVTTDGSKDIVYASSVHREEFGISKGTFWSNNGKQLAFYRMDQSMVNDYPIIDWSEQPAKNENIKYPMAGGKSHEVTVAVYNAESGSVVYLKTGLPAEQYLTNIAWTPDDQFVIIAVLNRQQNHMKLNQYSAVTGEFVKTLFEEKDEKYVEPLVSALFVKNNPNNFVWQSKRDGWNHFYLYSSNGKLIKQLTSGKWEVLEAKGFDESGQNLFYISTQESPLTKNLYAVNLATGISKRITAVTALHNTFISSDGKYVIDNFSNTETPKIIQLIETKTAKTKQLLQASNPLKDYALGNCSIFTIKSNSGDDLYCRLYQPVNFDSTKKYPTIVYVYGGPHAQLILNSWNAGSGDLWFQYMAERGYVVLTVDTRGSEHRGKAFEQSMFRKVGDVQMQDILSSVNFLKTKPYIDPAKMGLFGWSFGGFLTTDMMLNYPGVFKAAVAGGPVMNWSLYEIMYTERYMDTPQENPEGFAATDLTKQVEKLKGKLLLIHGLQDPVVVQQNSVNFVRACIDKGVQVDYMIYPGHEHNVVGKDRAHLYQKVTDYFLQNL